MINTDAFRDSARENQRMMKRVTGSDTKEAAIISSILDTNLLLCDVIDLLRGITPRE